MTKKEFIWLGIRTIGFYWLLRLILITVTPLWILGYWLISTITSPDKNNILSTVAISIFQIPVPLFLTIYFLFFGTLIYKLISHLVHTQPEDLSKPTGYWHCETLIRFIGLVCIGRIISMLGLTLWGPLQTALMFYLTQPERFQQQGFRAFLQYYCNIGTFFSIAIYLLIAALAAWYFFKHGKFFINLLNRLWLKATENNINQTPVNPV
jgi:hypothetical protein